MEALTFLFRYVGPAFVLLFPMSVLTAALLFWVLYSIRQEREISDWIEVLLAHLKETSTLIGLLGSVYAVTRSFDVDGASVSEIRENMFFVLSTGFWSTIAGVLISLEASLGLLLMKKS